MRPSPCTVLNEKLSCLSSIAPSGLVACRLVRLESNLFNGMSKESFPPKVAPDTLSHLSPVIPSGHKHLNVADDIFTHVPPLAHGFGLHGQSVPRKEF